jgi:2-polyprenyl-3-methyl-5-hydroxy-6-metoxy-1,4-benzoquinol methylase
MENLVKHPKYGFWQITPTPTKEQITEFYKNEFYSGAYKQYNDSSLEVQVQDREFYEGGLADMALHIAEILGKPLQSLSILDIGCGWSQALLFFEKMGMECFGFDPAPEAVEFANRKGLRVKLAGMDRMDVFDGMKFDIVVLKNVLEHLADPVNVLQQIRTDILKQGGLLIIDVPNEFNPFQTAGRDVHNLNDWWVSPPGHLNYFSKDTLKATLEGEGYAVKLAEASFPLEMFLLFGECYVGDEKLGRACHEKRVAFEQNLRKAGQENLLRQFYQCLAEMNLGRQITIYALAN